MRANDVTSWKIPSSVAYVVKKTPIFQGILKKFIPFSNGAHHWCVLSAKLMQSINADSSS